MRTLAIVAAFGAAVFLGPVPARAAFHLWEVNELYSSTDGLLQYVELRNFSDFENFIAGHSIIASGGGPNRTFTFPGNLASSSTANKTLLIATSNFQAITGVTPDYTLAAGFLSLTGGTVTFDGSGSSITYGAGAFTGVNSRGPGGVSLIPSATNFAGQTTVVPEPGSSLIAGACFLLATLGRARTRGRVALV